MRSVISNTSPLLYLYRIGVIAWLRRLFDEVWTPPAVQMELRIGREKGYDVPELTDYIWLHIVSPESVPSEWLTSDLGRGELETMALALAYPKHIVLLDDGLARKIAKAANLEVWGTLRVLLEAKEAGLTGSIGPLLNRLESSGMWLSKTVKKRVLKLAGE
jgi:hypothetical protein